jgi:hypothetical protein
VNERTITGWSVRQGEGFELRLDNGDIAVLDAKAVREMGGVSRVFPERVGADVGHGCDCGSGNKRSVHRVGCSFQPIIR